MTEFFAEYGLFLLKAMTVAGALVFVIAAAAAASRKAGSQEGLEVESLNRKYRSRAQALQKVVLSKSRWKAVAKADKARDKAAAKAKGERPRTFVIDFKGDLKASAVQSLREEVSAVLAVAGEGDEVVVRLENYGGVVHEHGLGASQLARVRDRNIPLTVTVD